MARLLTELGRRNVFKVAVAYDPAESITRATGRKLDFVIIGVLAVAVAYFVTDKYFLSAPTEAIGIGGVSEVLSSVGEVDGAINRGDWLRAYELARSLPPDVPGSARQQILSSVTHRATIHTEPPGAIVRWRPYDRPDLESEPVGTTPLEWDAPRAEVALDFSLEGFAPRTMALWVGAGARTAHLRSLDGERPLAIHIEGRTLGPALVDARLSHAFPYEIGSFLIDRYEVTNREYQEFVAAGGYERRQFWEHPFVRNGRELSFGEAMAELVDLTGRQGPATWSGGTFPAGMADHPVTGVSWYEAAAYASFVGRDLPTVFHWFAAALPSSAQYVVPFSNFDGGGTAAVGEYPGVTFGGAYDMAGNAREWLANATGDLRYTAGGGWNDPAYLFGLTQPQAPFDRSDTNGIRLMTNLETVAAYADAARDLDFIGRDFTIETPVSEAVFSAYREQYAYDPLPLNDAVEAVEAVEYGIRERITFDTGYDDDRMVLYLFRPPESRRALQTVVYFPGSGALNATDLDGYLSQNRHLSLIVRSGRAAAFPVFKSSFEREDGYAMNGEYDQIYPLETSARPFFDALGTPESDKRLFVAPGGHSIPFVDVTRETLNWLDEHLGPVR